MPINLENNNTNKPSSPRGRKKSTRTIEINSNDEVHELKSQICRTCLRRRQMKDFYVTTDPEWDTSGKFSICKFCIEDAYERYFVAEKSIDKSIHKLCKVLNARFDSSALESTKKHIETSESKGKSVTGIFGIYRKSLVNPASGWSGDGDLRYQEGIKYNAPAIDPSEYEDGAIEEVVKFWGEGMKPEEYMFLESEMDRYRKTHKCDTAAEESLLRQICFCELDIRKARTESGGTPAKSSIDMLQSLMKTASVDPAKTAVAGSGKSQDTFSAFIKTIEENEPADYYLNKELFKDYDNIDFYFRKYVVRPLKNFITQSRDFNVSEDNGGDEEDFDIREASED